MALPRGKHDPWGATCDVPTCEWSFTAYNEKEGRVVEVLHLLVRHPEHYRSVTGKDPDEQKFHYREYITAYERNI